MYIRKTRDIFVIEQNWGYGWEEVSTYTDRMEARKDLKAYRENQPEAPARIRAHREPIAK